MVLGHDPTNNEYETLILHVTLMPTFFIVNLYTLLHCALYILFGGQPHSSQLVNFYIIVVFYDRMFTSIYAELL